MIHQDNFPHGRSGIEICAADIAYIRNFVKSYPKLSRTEVICTLCEHLQWVTPGGRPKYDASTKLLAQLEQSGVISLPPLKESHSHKGQQKPRAPLEVVTPGDPVACTLAELGAVRLRPLSDAQDELQCNAAIGSFHPLGYKKPFGYVMRYRIEVDELGLGYLLFSGAAKKIQYRDKWIVLTAIKTRLNLAAGSNIGKAHAKYVFDGLD